ncbi:lysosomal dipeptide transporter MFSD1-like [Argopecten irradians]|uniref:lysosomal dipeptide transporter MFSD1-like n=1 Tax=Argopecten irradians TaxID=31199 RepID=UPI003720C6A5
MALLLQHHTPDGQTPKDSGNKLMTLKELRAVPVAYWLYTMLIACTAVCWVTKQTNLPDYLQLLHGYTMEEASRITGLAPLLMNFLVPFICLIMWKIDNNGIMFTAFTSLMVPLYYLLGFCPAANIYVISCLDGLRIAVAAVMMWQIVINLSPPSYVGTLVMITFTVRNIFIAVVSVATGYILQRHKVTTLEVALTNYQHYFIMLLTLSSTGTVCGVLMNIVDFRKGCSLNGRLKRWMETGTETTRLLSESGSDNCCGVKGINNDGVNEEMSMKSVLKTE